MQEAHYSYLMHLLIMQWVQYDQPDLVLAWLTLASRANSRGQAILQHIHNFMSLTDYHD